jgi:hypothetical protein
VYCHTDNIASQRRAKRRGLSERCVRRPVPFQKKPGLRYTFGCAYADATVFDDGHMLCDAKGWGWISINMSTSPKGFGGVCIICDGGRGCGLCSGRPFALTATEAILDGATRRTWLPARRGDGPTDKEATEVGTKPERATADEAGTYGAVGPS